MAKPWGGAGAWAAESELPEPLPLPPQPPFSIDSAFPSLNEAASSKPKKKKPQQTFSLSELTLGIHVGPRSKPLSESKGLTTEEMMMLPTGPRDRSDDEPQPFGGLGGGFKDYGGYRGGAREYGDRERSGRDGNRGGFGGDRDRDRDEPSRADANDDWGSSKKFVPSSGGSQRFEDDRRRGSRSSDQFSSKADEDDNWGSSKKFVAAPNGSDRRGVGRYEDIPPRGGFHDSHGSSKADEVDNWGSSKKSAPIVGGFDSSHRDRDYATARDRDGGADADKWSRKDVSRLPERPRLVLQPRSRPVDSSSPPPSRAEFENNSPERILPAKDDKSNLEVAPKPRKVNPFGEAKPREIILEEKGMKWKKFDAELERKSVDRAETEEELLLKEEIKALQEAIKSAEADPKASEVSTGVEEDQILPNVREQLAQKEWDLEQLTTALNDKVRFSRVGGERPASRSGNRESEKTTDMWTKSNGNDQPKPESKGGRW